MLSVVGGAVGIAGGLTCPWAMQWLRSILERAIPEAMNNLPAAVQNVAPQIVPWSIPVAFGISVVVGVSVDIGRVS